MPSVYKELFKNEQIKGLDFLTRVDSTPSGPSRQQHTITRVADGKVSMLQNKHF